MLEMLIRLTALQQVYQTSHLGVADEHLNFFLDESSTTGEADVEARKRLRRQAVQKVGFDPYNESPVKHHGEEYQYQNQGQYYEGGEAPYEYGEGHGSGNRKGSSGGYDGHESPRLVREKSMTPQRSPEPWLLRSREATSPKFLPVSSSSSPLEPFRQPSRRPPRSLERVMRERGVAKNGSPLGRGMGVETDSSLGTSPGSPTPVGKMGKGGDDEF